MSWVEAPDDYRDVYVLHVMSEDKRVFLATSLVDHSKYQKDENGDWFYIQPGLRRPVAYPPSPVPSSVTPSFVRGVVAQRLRG